jgi:NAD-dependent SIR2 family protein deacetylase
LKKYTTAFLIAAHGKSSSHKKEILESEECVCFYCQETYPPTEIVEWIEENNGGETAVCPKCGIDSILGSKSGLPISDKEFVYEMTEYFF